MKHKKLILSSIGISLLGLIVLLFFVLRGNFFKYTDINSMISEPKSDSLLISGTWKLESVTTISDGSESTSEDDKLYVSKNFVSFEKISTNNPKFKFRRLNFKNYLLYNGVITDKIKIDSDEVTVVSIRDEKNFYKEFIVIDENKISTIYNKKYYVFERVSFDVEENLIGDSSMEDVSKKKDISFLIGLKSVGTGNVDYETLLIRKNGEKKITINKVSGLFINNKNKFFIANSVGDKIYISDDYVNNSEKKILDIKNATINFLSENYISVESFNTDMSKKNYSIYNINSLSDENKISIKDIAGDRGEQAYFNKIRKLGYSSENITSFDMRNFGVKRNNFSWVFKGILNNYSHNNFISSEINLDLIPKVNIFLNKSSKISKIKVKEKTQNVLDYFISPDESMIVILTADDISVYEIKNQKIETLPISTISLNSRREVVNFQWESAISSELTYNEFLKIKQLELKKTI
ncbi:hypothetical protein HMPREF3181_00191 [Parvimonas sp. KA00067]|uniref:hypothetical protein n=1 Tax=Parvimonas sp. KA00067 TaxID=1588755 RepID=UPI000791E749|nr:hypothetical protein [Parvimonas sp. KA00067]KXB67591.1 hypothetical protein HMPREF3181_00191 [Parvimonas sp. KA00067]